MSKFNIKTWFKKTEKINPELTQITFTVNGDKVNIAIAINSNDINVGSNFGKLLYNIDGGHLKKPIAKMLLDLSIQKPLYKPIIEEAIECWLKLISTENKEKTDLCIKPSQVFSQK